MFADFDAYVTAAFFDRDGTAMFALGDGSVAFAGGERIAAHDGAVLCARPHPKGPGLLTGGDDGRVVWSRRGEASEELAKIPGRWIEALDVSPDSGLFAFAAGRDLNVRDAGDPTFSRVFAHERQVADVAFEPRGRRIATASYGGAFLWYARIAEQKPVKLTWAGAHIGLAFSPDGRFLMSAMQENALHGWRLNDAKDLKMGGYPAKVKSLAFVADGQFLATSGANGAVLWPFGGSNGPMGKAATEVGFDQAALVTRVAGTAKRDILAAGLDDGRVWVCSLAAERTEFLRAEKGTPVTALAISADGKSVAWGDEAGAAGVGEVTV